MTTTEAPQLISDEHIWEEIRSHQLDVDRLRTDGCPVELEPLFAQLESPEDMSVWAGKNLRYIRHPDKFYSFTDVIKHGEIDCFTGAFFYLTLMHFRGYCPKIVLLHGCDAHTHPIHGEVPEDEDHNIVPFFGRGMTGEEKYGAVAASEWETLKYREPNYKNDYELARSYWRAYKHLNPAYKLQTLVGYSDPIDPVGIYGEKELFALLFSTGNDLAMKKIYDTYTNGVMCTGMDGKLRYLYPHQTLSVL